MATRLFLVRHGQTTADAGCFVGSTDLGLSGQGLERLARVSSHVNCLEDWYCSPMIRTRQTLDKLAEFDSTVTRVTHDSRLREIDFGRWEMQTFAEIAATDPELLAGWQQYLDFSFPKGESVADFVCRVQEMLDSLCALDKESVGVMTHGGVIRTMICLSLGLSPRNYLLFDVAPASLCILDVYSDGAILKGLNL